MARTRITPVVSKQVAASRLLGNATGSPANESEVSLGDGLEFNGGAVRAKLGAGLAASGGAIVDVCPSRAFVNFNGTGTVAIRNSFNVSSITDNGTGSYTVNFTSPMPSVNYGWSVGMGVAGSGSGVGINGNTNNLTTSALPILTAVTSTPVDMTYVTVNVFGG